ncbi:MAG: adenylosuccinate synthase [Anaerolinea sp.]|nr:adenylosuccinate synthase [Anaerolinea sp.]
MTIIIVVGAQWGDEGKGRVVDLLSEEVEVVARYNGGDNAGHTVTLNDQTFKLHLIPSGIIHPHTLAMLGNGVVINPLALLSEMQTLRSAGLVINEQRLRLSYAAHLITPAHRALDAAQEAARGNCSIGTTGRGIGPAYTDRAARQGLRLGDILKNDFEQRLQQHLQAANHTLQALYGAAHLDIHQAMADYLPAALALRPYIGDVGQELHNLLRSGKRLLIEGAQGCLLDLDLGSYPYVTSSCTTAAGALAGLGLGLQPAERVIGVTKAFQTRVGAGPFPTEVFGAEAERLRGSGANPWDEFGTTTGRARRVGWLDGVLLRYAVRINGLTELILTKLDILSGLETVRIATSYVENLTARHETLPLGPSNLSNVAPIYEEVPGWSEPLGALRHWQDLPQAAQHFIRRIETIAGCPVRQVSVGPERSQIIDVPNANEA